MTNSWNSNILSGCSNLFPIISGQQIRTTMAAGSSSAHRQPEPRKVFAAPNHLSNQASNVGINFVADLLVTSYAF